MNSYRAIFAVLLLPVAVLTLLEAGPGLLYSTWGRGEFDGQWAKYLASPAAVVSEKSGPTVSGSGQSQAPGQTSGDPKAARSKASFHAAELQTRLKFGAASALLHVVALLAIVFAIAQLRTGWRANAARPGNATVLPLEQRVVTVLAVALTAAAFTYAYAYWSSEPVRDTLLLPPIAEAQKASFGTATADLTATIQMMKSRNYLVGYVAAALLLAYLIALSIDSTAPMTEEDRLVGLQFVLALGAALFSAAVLTDKARIAFTIEILDAAKAKELITAINLLPDIWALAYSGFLITAIGTAYFAIRGSDATVRAQPAAGQAVADSMLALRTPDRKDFKILGWIVNFVVAFAPIWLTEGITKFLNFAKAGIQ